MDNVANDNSLFNSCQDLVTAYQLFTDKLHDLIFYKMDTSELRIYFTFVKNIKKNFGWCQ
jgi:hypothetical protein